MATNTVQIPPLATNLNDPALTNQTAKEWYLYWKRSGDRINTLNGMIGYGSHASRLAPALAPDGALYVDSDYSGIIYQNQGGAWHYLAGTMWGTISPDQRPTDLGKNDAGFEFRSIDSDPLLGGHTWIWSGSVWIEVTPNRYGTHASRLALTPGGTWNGMIWAETDRSEVIYQLQSGVWHFLAGTMWGTISPDQRPTDLGANDAGFHFRGTDQAREFIWSGTVWVEVGTSNYDVNGALIGTRATLNLIAGTNVTISGVDNAASNRVDVTIASSGGGTGGAVTSVFGRTGAVNALSGDYSASMVTNAVSTASTYADPAWITALSWSKITGAPATGVSTVFGRSGTVVAASGDYTAAQITNAVSTASTYADPAWITALGWSKITGAPAFLTSLTPWTSNIAGAGYRLDNVAAIGIGISGSADKLSLGTDITAQKLALYDGAAGNWYGLGMKSGGIRYETATAGNHVFCTGTTEQIVLNATGLGIFLYPSYALHLATDSAAKPTTNTWTIASGAAVKKNVKALEGGLKIINQLRPTEAEYNGKGRTPADQRVVSLIAEEVRQILPHTVTEDSEGNLGFNVHEVIFHLILAVQQLSAQVGKP